MHKLFLYIIWLFVFFIYAKVQAQTTCTISGVTVTATGSTRSGYLNPPTNPGGCTSASFIGSGIWTGFSSTGIILYTFSQPITSIRISYSAVNTADILAFTTNTGGTISLSNPCNVTIPSSNRIKGVANYTDSWITVTSTIPFTTLTSTNVGGSSGWVQGDLCDFTISSCDLNNPNDDCDGDGVNNGIDCDPQDPNAYTDVDNDGVCDVSDLDNDNDGILDSVEGCTSGMQDISALSFNGNTVASTTTNSITTRTDSRWSTSYSNEDFDLPLRLKFKAGTLHNMVGFLPNGGTQRLTTWNDGAYKVYSTPNRMYGKLLTTWNPFNITRAANDIFVLEIDVSGNLTLTQNGITRFTGTAPVTSYKLAITSITATTISEIEFTHGNSFACADTDNDGIANYLDLDSDGDGCSDADEAYNNVNADGNDDGIYGTGTPSVNADGTVIGASYATPYDSEPNGIPDFLQSGPIPVITTALTNTTAFSGSNGVFSIAATNADIFSWEVSTDNGTTYNSIVDGTEYNGTQTATLTIIKAGLDKNGYLYRVKLSNQAYICSEESSSASLFVRLRTVITNRRITYRVKK
ncbi:thrombospondin type 3 repeat-containing protein [uncultured Maribacter sp.]|uniref:thrombospondin type 3 repeat-containing protein n=1 Tax=uncultured Maribacter sp. TaxID=431308 RepID=UPI002606E03E|nr:thrombospondin type 3 repeat-containing protein [uncultured Maribacter sp.]